MIFICRSAILSLRDWQGGTTESGGQLSPIHSNNSASMDIEDAFQHTQPQPGTMEGPRGRRMRRNDSIVQQLSYEAAILHEALEEFSEDSDVGVADDLMISEDATDNVQVI